MALKVKYDRNGCANIVGEIDASSNGRPRRRRRRHAGIAGAVLQKLAPRRVHSKLAAIGLVFDKGLDTGAYTDPIPTKFRVVVYQLMQNRALIGEGTKFWQKDTDFVEDTERQAVDKAKQYIAKQNWKLAAISDYTAKPTS